MLRASLVIGCWVLAVTIFVDFGSTEEVVGEDGGEDKGEGGVDGRTERSDGVEASKDKEAGKELNKELSAKGVGMSANENLKTRSGEFKANMDETSVGEERNRENKEKVSADKIKGHAVKNINELETSSKISNVVNGVEVKSTETTKSSVIESATQVTTKKTEEIGGRGLGFGGPQGIPFGASKDKRQEYAFGAGRGPPSTWSNNSRVEGQVFGAGRGLGVGSISSADLNKSTHEGQAFGAGRGLGVDPFKPLSTGLNKSTLEGQAFGGGRGLGTGLTKGRLREELFGGGRGLGFGGRVPERERWRGRGVHNRLADVTRGQGAGGLRYGINKSWVDPFVNPSRIRDLNEYYRVQSVEFGMSNRSVRPAVGGRMGINGTRVGTNGSGILGRLGAGRGGYVGGRLGGGMYSGMRIMAGAQRRRVMGNATAGALPESGWARLGGVGARLGEVGPLREGERGRFGGARVGERGRIGSAGRFVGRREWEWGAGRFAAANGTRRGVLGGAGGFGGIRRVGLGRFGGGFGVAGEGANGTARGFGRGGFGAAGFEGIRRGGFGGFGGGRLGQAAENGTAGGLRRGFGGGMGAREGALGRSGFASGRFVPGVGKPGEPRVGAGGPGSGFGRGGPRPNLFGPGARVGAGGPARGAGPLGRVRSGAGAPPPGAGRGKFGAARGRPGFSRPGFRADDKRRRGRGRGFKYGRKPRRRQSKAKTMAELKKVTYHLLRNARLGYPNRTRGDQPYEIQLKKLRTAMLLAHQQRQAVDGEQRLAKKGY